MRRFLKALVVGLMLVLAPMVLGCAGTFCNNAPGVATSLQSTVDVLKVQVAQLQGVLLNGYDAEIEAAYLAAKVSLTAAQALLAQWCPKPTEVDDAVKNASTNVTPKANAAMKRAYSLGLAKP